jgi:two-component system, NarL family, nitrate/nitrite response regulator NarL
MHLPQTQKASFRSRDGSHWVISKPPSRESGSKGRDDSEFAFRVLIVDRDSMSGDLLATALTRDRDCQAFAIGSVDLMGRIADGKAQLVVIGADLNQDTRNGFELARTVRRTHPAMPIVILLNQSTHDSVINAFRSGASGVFSRQQPLADFLECVDHVRKGCLWAGKDETTLLLSALSSLPSPNMSMESDTSPLTIRELQVVKCAARGKTNKVIASELGLSEHTVKNYLFRAFDKLGVSNRVELLFYLTQRGHTVDAGRANYPEGLGKADLTSD